MNIILVDSSFTSFYRFFSTIRWMSMAHKEEYKKYKDDIKYDWSKNKIFIDKYTTMYLKGIENIVKKKVFKNSIIIFCLDSPQSTLWRNTIDKTYKGERVDLSLKRNFKPTFKYTYSKLIPKLVSENDNIYSIKIPKVEADDIIAVITKNVSTNTYIVSGDHDFLQLGNKNVYFANYRKKKVFQLTSKEAKENLRQKLVCGDNSDNIKCIFMKETKKGERKKIKENIDYMNKYLKENNEAMKRYKHNMKMIDFKMIPKKYVKSILKEFNNIYNVIN